MLNLQNLMEIYALLSADTFKCWPFCHMKFSSGLFLKERVVERFLETKDKLMCKLLHDLDNNRTRRTLLVWSTFSTSYSETSCTEPSVSSRTLTRPSDSSGVPSSGFSWVAEKRRNEVMSLKAHIQTPCELRCGNIKDLQGYNQDLFFVWMSQQL